jgi:hypothetical protein
VVAPADAEDREEDAGRALALDEALELAGVMPMLKLPSVDRITRFTAALSKPGFRLIPESGKMVEACRARTAPSFPPPVENLSQSNRVIVFSTDAVRCTETVASSSWTDCEPSATSSRPTALASISS